MFFGASSIEPDNISAVGCLLSTAQKYTRMHGPGAIVFMHGYGDRLAIALKDIGVMCLDCSSRDRHMINLNDVKSHQRSWCADEYGNILP